MHWLFYLLFCFVFTFPAFAEGNDIDNLQQRLEVVNQFTGAFDQENYISFQDRKIFGKGKVAYLKPTMRWEYAKPDEQLIVIGKEKIWIYDPILENVTVQDITKVASATSLSFLLGKGKLKNDFIVIQRKKDYLDSFSHHKAMFLQPKLKDQGFTELQLSYDKTTFQIYQLVLVDAQGSYRKITFSNLKFDSDLSPSDFVFQIKENMEVISE